MEAIVDRLIPPDSEFAGGKNAGCAVFIDRQLAGPYGRAEALYRLGPFAQGTKQQGPQSPLAPAQQYRRALAALDRFCQDYRGGKSFHELEGAQQDDILSRIEQGTIQLAGLDGAAFFKVLLKDVKEGFFADPLYGGNKDMVSWRMIGFPGARYDYRDWVTQHNKPYPLPPVSIAGRAAWTPSKS